MLCKCFWIDSKMLINMCDYAAIEKSMRLSFDVVLVCVCETSDIAVCWTFFFFAPIFLPPLLHRNVCICA